MNADNEKLRLNRAGIVGGDLDFLSRLPLDRLPTRTEVRIISGVLRRLCNEGVLEHCWNEMGLGGRFTLTARNLDATLDKLLPNHLVYGWAGSAMTTAPASHAGFVSAAVSKKEWIKFGTPERAIQQLYPEGIPSLVDNEANVSVREFFAGSSFAIGRQSGPFGPSIRVSRHNVVRYVANRLGGVHLSHKRPPLTLDSKQGDIADHALDIDLIMVGNLPGPLYEVFAMAIDIGQSAAARMLVDRARKLVPDAFGGDPRQIRFWSPTVDGKGEWNTIYHPPEAQH